jgi:hypothetical protein
MSPIEQIAQWCEPWNHLFSHSTAISGTVLGVHILALMFGGGLAIASDRAVLRADRPDGAPRGTVLRDVHTVHRPVLVALAFMLLSGVLLALSDVETFLPSPWFWLKLTLVVLLLANGGMLTLTEGRVRRAPPDDASVGRHWRRLRTLSTFSLILWTATAIAGIVLSNSG